MASDFENRFAKNVKHRFKWAERAGLTAFRLFDLDIPEWPFAVDWYAGFVHVIEYPRRRQVREGSLEGARIEVVRAIAQVLSIDPTKIFTKTHEPKPWGTAPTLQRGPNRDNEGRGAEARSSPELAPGNSAAQVLVTEHGLTFECNLSDYLDTGLFLDHRVTRERVMKEAKGTRFLNLFAYTGSFTVHARAGAAKETTTVDLSNTYCDWAERNLRHNRFEPSASHQVLRADVLAWLEASPERPQYELAVVDPPSFSSSKKMGRRWEVQRDHRHLIEQVLARLTPGGTLYFSTNFLNFELDSRLPTSTELTPKSIPEDFRRTVHRCWKFVRA